MSKRKKGRAKYRRRLWENDPHCYWCNVETLWWEGNGSGSATSATIDHIFSKYSNHPNRHKKEFMVLACWKCNHDRNEEEIKTIPIHILRKHSQNPSRAKSKNILEHSKKENSAY